MSTGINQTHRIVIAIAIQVQAVDGFWVQVGSVVGRDESSPLGTVIPGVAVVQAGVVGMVIAIVTNMVDFGPATSAYLFYHFPRPQSRKSLPDRDDPGDLNIIV